MEMLFWIMSLQGGIWSYPSSQSQYSAWHLFCFSIHPLLSHIPCSTVPSHHFCNTLHGGCNKSACFGCDSSSILKLGPQWFMWFWSKFFLAFNTRSFIFCSLRMPSVLWKPIARLSSWKFSKFASSGFTWCMLPTCCILMFPMEYPGQERIWDLFSLLLKNETLYRFFYFSGMQLPFSPHEFPLYLWGGLAETPPQWISPF